MQLREEFSSVANTVAANAREQVNTLSLVIGLQERNRLRTSAGPILLVAGLILGFIGNVWSLAAG
jgi:hypothetical protein